MRWKKLGLVFCPTDRTHAMIPIPFLTRDRLRVYYSSCDSKGAGRPAYVDLDPDTLKVTYKSALLLELGGPGTFDDNGIVACSVVPLNDKTAFMYYVGFELGVQIRYKLFTGLAISEDGGKTFRKHSTTPILDRSSSELFFRCGPFVMREGVFRMWYVAGSEWTEVDGKKVPVYDMRYMESPDGIAWPDKGTVCMEIGDTDEHGFGRPYVVKRSGAYDLFYSIRKKSAAAYRMGYATSIDGLTWDRRDGELGLDVSPGSWDSQSTCYGALCQIGGRELMFYNGNGFGRCGFGVAVREDLS